MSDKEYCECEYVYKPNSVIMYEGSDDKQICRKCKKPFKGGKAEWTKGKYLTEEAVYYNYPKQFIPVYLIKKTFKCLYKTAEEYEYLKGLCTLLQDMRWIELNEIELKSDRELKEKIKRLRNRLNING